MYINLGILVDCFIKSCRRSCEDVQNFVWSVSKMVAAIEAAVTSKGEGAWKGFVTV